MIDGAFGHSIRLNRFLRELHEGKIPHPLSSSGPTALDGLCAHSSPGVLARHKTSLLAAFDLTDEVLAQAETSSSILCPACGSAAARFKTPIALIETIVREFATSEVCISAIAPNAELTAWAERHGFSTQSNAMGLQEVLLHRTHASSESIGQLASLLRSLWSLPAVHFQCRDDRRACSYARHGWCATCATALPPIKGTRIRAVLESGIANTGSPPYETLLIVKGGVTVEQLLRTPLAQLPRTLDSRVAETLSLATQCGLGELHLGLNTQSLGAADLAALSLCRGLLDGAKTSCAVIVDIPAHILSGARFTKVHDALTESAASAPIIIPSEATSPGPLSPDRKQTRMAGASVGTISIETATPKRFELHLGTTLHIRREDLGVPSLFNLLSEALSGAETERGGIIGYSAHIAAQVHPVRIFSGRGSSHGTLIEALGLGDRLAELYAASVNARSLGLRPRDFSLGATRTNPHLCSACKGLGVTLEFNESLPRPLAAPCHLCCGFRCKAPVRDSLFRGISFSHMLNQTFGEALPVLKALPKAARVLKLIELFELQGLPPGMPLTLLSDSERRATTLVRAILQTTRAKPSILLIEEATLALSPQQHVALSEVLGAWPEGEFLASLEVSEQ